MEEAREAEDEKGSVGEPRARAWGGSEIKGSKMRNTIKHCAAHESWQ